MPVAATLVRDFDERARRVDLMPVTSARVARATNAAPAATSTCKGLKVSNGAPETGKSATVNTSNAVTAPTAAATKGEEINIPMRYPTEDVIANAQNA